ncbi:MAG TPA: family 16 glycoside hydrolase [Anaerolineae bacterium]|nr:family 16 glycoside hydrolase [Anaerolineae bacterium]
MKTKLVLIFFVLFIPVLSACSPTLTPLPYTDDFSTAVGDPDSGWKTASDEALKIQIQDGALHFTIDELDTIAWSTPKDKRFGDFVLDVDATQVTEPSDNTYGVIFRYQDDRNFYRLDISGDGYFAVFKRKDGAWTKVQDYVETPAVKQGNATNHLQVIAKGNQFTFNVNGQPVKTFSDSDFPNGNIGVTAGTLFDNAGVHIAFDNVTVSEVKP